jgi:microcystin-dependent protein
MKKVLLTSVAFLFLINTKAQVSIGTQSVPNVRAILDLTNGSNLGLLLPITLGDPSVSFPSDPEGMLLYHKDNLFLKGSSMWNPITPWKSKFVADAPVNVYFNPAGYTGVGIGIDGNVASNIKANLHVAFNSKEVSVANSNAAIMIGDTDAGVAYMSFDNDEIAVKTGIVAPAFGTLKLQEGGGTVQVGESQTAQSTLNVFGKVQESGYAVVPQGVIVMWSGSLANIPEGWALCNGNWYNPTNFSDVGSSGTSTGAYTKKTPDLRNRFIVGAGDTYFVADIGGNNSSAHAHDVDPDSFNTIATEGKHGHSGTTSGSTDRIKKTNTCCDLDWVARDNHTHTFSTPNTQGAHTHSIDVPNTTSGEASNTENRPPYYALAFIMKL